MHKNIFKILIFVFILSLLFFNAKDPDKKNKDNPKKDNKQTQQGDKKKNDNIEVIYANENFMAEEILSRPADKSITINIVPAKNMSIYAEYGIASGNYTDKTPEINAESAKSIEIAIDNLKKNTVYFYRMRFKLNNANDYSSGKEHSFTTQRSEGNSFSFAVQGDSHPERAKQFDAELYKTTMLNVQKNKPDFYLIMGDDFSVDTLSEITQEQVRKIYLRQRYYLGMIGNSSPLFLVNGNHEQAALYVLNDTPDNNAVWAQNMRNLYYSQPAPDGFYTGDEEKVKFIGYLRDYYAWTWGDALFVVIDPYWHSKTPVDNVLRGGEKRADMWEITLGDKQYQWLKETLLKSNAKYKFVFTHHVLGTGRGGVEMADLYEWGGKNKDGVNEFNKKRPGWDLTIHQIMVKAKVTIFFQGHDHIFVKQELDGVIYQELPEPADPQYMAYNEDAYKTGIKFPNAGFVKVTVTEKNLKVDYIRSFLAKDETGGHKNGETAYSYTVLPE